ncbi:competence type IV pilus major pilin ComGC [Bacillus ndiopicus]|uniref:competence type IV pilus major pilin ComGC n=1 Tax=Bacillus ndiopicus TaxID=1347368 RepID=UPI0005A8FA54|nr:competence type IV pilus major pilin ComGC [Bacillus ndiopicus]
MKNEKGFTLVEMLVVLLIVSILILVTIPNVTKHFASIDSKGCSAYMTMLQGQVEAYKIDHMTTPTVSDLFSEKYIDSEEAKCPSGELVTIDAEGKVMLVGKSEGG